MLEGRGEEFRGPEHLDPQHLSLATECYGSTENSPLASR